MTRNKQLITISSAACMIVIIAAASWIFLANKTPLPGIQTPIQSWDHIPPGTKFSSYKSNPPTSGPHYPDSASCKFHENGVSIQQLLHNMEHGHVVLLYQRGTDMATIEKIKKLTEELSPKGWFLASAYDNIPSKFAIASWGWHQPFDIYDEDLIRKFYEAHKEKGREYLSCALQMDPKKR